jgi:drug/metabolite transporter (DMT)-like permease
MEEKGQNGKKYLFDNPKNVKRLLGCFFSSLVVLLIIEFFIHKHPHFPWEGWLEFYAVYGFVACVALVLAAKYILRPLMKRREDYYD